VGEKEDAHVMKTVQMTLDEPLLAAVEHAVKKLRTPRCAFNRQASIPDAPIRSLDRLLGTEVSAHGGEVGTVKTLHRPRRRGGNAGAVERIGGPRLLGALGARRTGRKAVSRHLRDQGRAVRSRGVGARTVAGPSWKPKDRDPAGPGFGFSRPSVAPPCRHGGLGRVTSPRTFDLSTP